MSTSKKADHEFDDDDTIAARIGPEAITVYNFLLFLQEKDASQQLSWRKDAAWYCGLSKHEVERAIDVLQGHKLLAVQPLPDMGKDQVSPAFTVIEVNIFAPPQNGDASAG